MIKIVYFSGPVGIPLRLGKNKFMRWITRQSKPIRSLFCLIIRASITVETNIHLLQFIKAVIMHSTGVIGNRNIKKKKKKKEKKS